MVWIFFIFITWLFMVINFEILEDWDAWISYTVKYASNVFICHRKHVDWSNIHWLGSVTAPWSGQVLFRFSEVIQCIHKLRAFSSDSLKQREYSLCWSNKKLLAYHCQTNAGHCLTVSVCRNVTNKKHVLDKITNIFYKEETRLIKREMYLCTPF